jgi:hypothetical protein
MSERGEAEIRQDAAMWALVAELEALKSDRAALEASGEYPPSSFFEIAKAMQDIARRLREEV